MRQPRIVPVESTIVPADASLAAPGIVWPSRSAISRTDAGTYTDPAHRPTIDTSSNAELIHVRRA
jgi:hypothetical protein